MALLFAMQSLYGQTILNYFENREVAVTIPEGSTAQEIDAILSAAHVTMPGAFSTLAEAEDKEGYLFPDTYRFFKESAPQRVMEIMTDTFERKAAPLFQDGTVPIYDTIIIASLLEKEVVDFNERRIVAGVIKKRLAEGMPLQVDATICYIKKVESDPPGQPCYPLTGLDLRIDSPYNSYLYQGLPPGPIGNPGIDALTATVQAQASPYWYYLTDPATGRTIFSKTHEEHEEQRERYLSNS